ncbi:uncharacterized protein LOC127702932 [Mytilus californianus]|uniref:uncharacterized protein LOC127702932 n=1 Tax=Mytilus californianus TaxID=6549 RepID=UPI0022471BC9|nr:uncharacterized protein LOC127702932 [Mytilus californianus]
MDTRKLFLNLILTHGNKVTDVEESIKELQKYENDNNLNKFKETLSKLSQKEPGLALDTFGLIRGCRFEDGCHRQQTVRDNDVEKTNASKPAATTAPHPKPAYRPDSLADLIDIIRNATQKGQPIKAVGTNHSLEWTDIEQTHGIRIDMSQLNDVSHINREVLKTEFQGQFDDRMLCSFEAGATIKRVQEYLWPVEFRETRHPEQYRVLPKQTGCTNLSLSDTIANGGHENGFTKSIIAEMVLSICLLTVNKIGEVVHKHIEPTNGITNPAAFEKKFKERVLIQNDNTFHAALNNIGGLGFAYSYTLRAENAYYLTEYRYMVTWEEAQKEIPMLYNRNINERERKPGSLHSFELFISPYPMLHGGPVDVIVCTLEYSSGLPEGSRPRWYIIPHEWIRLGFVRACDTYPDIIPLLMNNIMRCTITQEPVTMNAPKALDPLSGLKESGQVTVSECAIETQTPADVIKKIQSLIDRYQIIRKENKHQLATSPFVVRFSVSSGVYMPMQYNRLSMVIISNMLVGTPNAENTLQQFRNLTQNEFNGLLHLSMVQDADVNSLRQMYPTNENAYKGHVATFKRVIQ